MIKNRFRAWDGEFMRGPFNLSDLGGWIWDGLIWMQFAGLHDKNGVDIWEGDLIQWGLYSNPYEVKRDGGCFGFYHMTNDGRGPDGFHFIKNLNEMSEHIKVLGNIWENPELLK